MLTTNFSAMRSNLKKYCDTVCEQNETIIVPYEEGKSVVLMSLDKYNQMTEAIRNAKNPDTTGGGPAT
ncbi:MAG: type II toxin-antitoxin system Phd/YefM family antitoxin [Lachnospiraceae bacterium]|nr:type II toxin-antitoxin system Phd/YefM family antitoxin [Lachnospiraceae bacterium]